MKRTIYSIAEGIQKSDKSGKVTPQSKPITVGLKPADPPYGPGLHFLSPSQAAGVFVDVLKIDTDGKGGYQRHVDTAHVRRIARQMDQNQPMPPVILAVENGDYCEVVDGQHRLLAAIMARKSIWATATELAETERQRLFAGQRRAKVVDRATLILAGNGPVDEYIQDAVTSDDHAWSRDLTAGSGTQNHIPVATAHNAILAYVLGVGATAGSIMRDEQFIAEHWSPKYADELAGLIHAFGNKKTNPTAFQAFRLRGIVTAAVACIRRPGSKTKDKERWARVMPMFPWAEYPHLRRTVEVADALIAHWNKRLPQDKRVSR